MQLRTILFTAFLCITPFFLCNAQVIPGETVHLLSAKDIDDSISHFAANDQPIQLIDYINSLAPLSYDSQSFENYSEAVQNVIEVHADFVQKNPILLTPLAKALYSVGTNSGFYNGRGSYNPNNIITLQNMANALSGTDSNTTSIKWSVNHYAELLNRLFAYVPSAVIPEANRPSPQYPPLANPLTNNPPSPVGKQPASWAFIPPYPGHKPCHNQAQCHCK